MPDDAIWPGVPAGMFPRLRAAAAQDRWSAGGQPCLTDGGGDGGEVDEKMVGWYCKGTRPSTIKIGERQEIGGEVNHV